jgi:hypothetical protein
VTKLSAKSFRDDLLTVLGNLSEWTADQPVKSEDVLDGVCTAKGITVDQFGFRDYDEKPQVVIWIRDAFRWAKRNDLGIQVKRGQWALSTKGLKRAAKLVGKEDLILAPADDDSTPPQTDGVNLMVGPGNADDGYHIDPWIRALAAEQTPCYGHYSAKSTICESCGLAGGCQNLVAAFYRTLADELAQKDVEEARLAAEAAKLVQGQPPTPDPSTKSTIPPTSSPPPEGWDNSGIQSIVSFVESTCYRCGQTIPKREPCYWVKDGAQRGGMFHKHCK